MEGHNIEILSLVNVDFCRGAEEDMEEPLLDAASTSEGNFPVATDGDDGEGLASTSGMRLVADGPHAVRVRDNFRSNYFRTLIGSPRYRVGAPSEQSRARKRERLELLRPPTSADDDTFDEVFKFHSYDGPGLSPTSSPGLQVSPPASSIVSRETALSFSSDSSGVSGPKPVALGDGMASISRSIFNLTNTSIGAGILAMPYFYESSGLLLGTVLLICIAVMSAFSLHLLVLCFRKDAVAGSYIGAAYSAFGQRGSTAVQISMLLLTFGAITTYFIIMGTICCQTIVQLVLPSIGGTDSSAHNMHCSIPSTVPTYCNRNIWSAIMGVLPILPLSLLKNLSALGAFSLLSIAAVLWLSILIVWDSVSHGFHIDITNTTAGGPNILAHWSMKLFFSLPTVCLAFLNHTNIHGIVEEMERPSKPRVRTLITSSTLIAAVLYICVGIMGYLRFGDKTEDDIFLSYVNLSRTKTVLFCTGRIGLLICLVCSTPLIVHPCRLCLVRFPR